MLFRPRALFVTTSRFESGIHTVRALQALGFQVAAHCPASHLFRKMRGVQTFRPGCSWRTWKTSLCRAMRQWQPDVLVPCDDAAVRFLHRIHQTVPRWSDLIAKSLGDPAGFPAIGSRIRFLSAISDIQEVLVPAWFVVRDEDSLRAPMDFPLVLKQEHSSGGCGVRIAGNQQAAQAAYRELMTRPTVLGCAREFVENAIQGTIHGKDNNCFEVVAQRYISGRPANRAVFCWKGRVLAGISVQVVKSFHETGPATVVQRIDHAGMEQSVAAAVNLLGISGFCGFDFILEEGSQRAWLLEMNPRITSISHLAWGERGDIPAAFATTYSGHAAQPGPSLTCETLVLFPWELRRDPESPYLAGFQPDVPQDDPQLLAVWLRRNAQTDFYSRVQRTFMNIRKCIPGCFLNPVRPASQNYLGSSLSQASTLNQQDAAFTIMKRSAHEIPHRIPEVPH